ncbi:hypothetical protein ACIHCV_44840 [Streptomyces sp. NPDC051956]|uniref:hypothetical protein n=1 Tax=Streptomyces sp. NPDC051956 TaxID=3365677 RepID=UPI0037D0AA52
MAVDEPGNADDRRSEVELADWNEYPRPFVWTKTADEILDKFAAYRRRISDSGH